jgi:hypothetical protein
MIASEAPCAMSITKKLYLGPSAYGTRDVRCHPLHLQWKSDIFCFLEVNFLSDLLHCHPTFSSACHLFLKHGPNPSSTEFSNNNSLGFVRNLCLPVQRTSLFAERQKTCTISVQNSRRLQEDDSRGRFSDRKLRARSRIPIHQFKGTVFCAFQVSDQLSRQHPERF